MPEPIPPSPPGTTSPRTSGRPRAAGLGLAVAVLCSSASASSAARSDVRTNGATPAQPLDTLRSSDPAEPLERRRALRTCSWQRTVPAGAGPTSPDCARPRTGAGAGARAVSGRRLTLSRPAGEPRPLLGGGGRPRDARKKNWRTTYGRVGGAGILRGMPRRHAPLVRSSRVYPQHAMDEAFLARGRMSTTMSPGRSIPGRHFCAVLVLAAPSCCEHPETSNRAGLAAARRALSWPMPPFMSAADRVRAELHDEFGQILTAIC